MSATSPLLFDRATLRLRRARASAEALFLHETARSEVEDRLSLINRSFTSPAIVSPFPAIWETAFPGARIIADEDVLDLAPGAHDLVMHALALHAANDPVGQLIQCRRALKPDGLFLGFLLGGQTLAELRSALGQAEVETTGGLSPRIAPMAEIRDLGALLQRAGFALPVADAVTLTAEYRDLWHLMRDLRAMGETNALVGRLRRLTRRQVFARADALYREMHGTQGGRLPATFEIICLTGWAPDVSQPQPLRPGTARTRLAEALGTDELKLPD